MVFTKRRLGGKVARERRRAADRKVVLEGEHLLPRHLREQEEGTLAPVEEVKNVAKVVGTEKIRGKLRRRLRVDGGVEEEMDMD